MRVLLVEPKSPQNIGGAIRAIACFGGGDLRFTGHLPSHCGQARLRKLVEGASCRHSRYGVVAWGWLDRLPDLSSGVCVEVDGEQPLPGAVIPADPVFVFGREDSSVPREVRRQCATSVRIPSAHCLNLAAAVYVTLYEFAARGRKPLELGL